MFWTPGYLFPDLGQIDMEVIQSFFGYILYIQMSTYEMSI